MAKQADWSKTNLKRYLRGSDWHPYKALWILAGFLMLDGDNPDDWDGMTKKECRDYSFLTALWDARPESRSVPDFYNDPHTPAYYIDWALSKRIRPVWLDWAIEQQLYIPKREAAKTAPSEISPEGKTETASAITSGSDVPDKLLANLFDPVTVTALAKMFPTKKGDVVASNSQWKNWAERASTNGLVDSRQGRAKFNSYQAAIWFLSKKIEGWDLARCHRVLANNLPARSIDQKHLLVGDQDQD